MSGSAGLSVGGAVLAGGQSRRFGSTKSLAPVGDRPMGAKVAAAIRDAGIDPVVVIGASTDAAAKLGLVLVPDQFQAQGPLAGTATALSYFTGTHVLVAACDLPLIDPRTVKQLVANASAHTATVAAVGGEAQVSLGCWPRSMYRQLLAAVRDGERRWRSLLDLVDVNLIEVSPDSVADADDEQTLFDLMARGDQ